MSKVRGVYIPSIDGKDLMMAEMIRNKQPDYHYTLKTSKGEWNTRKFKNVFDYSIDLIDAREVAKKKYRGTGKSFTFECKGKEYCPYIINLNFNFSLKEYNRFNTIENGKVYTTYVREGYRVDELEFEDCVAIVNDELVGVICGKPIVRAVEYPCFKIVKEVVNDVLVETYEYTNSKTIMKADEIREELYVNGFYVDGVHYVRFKRSSGSARVGKCLFIDEDLYDDMFEFSRCGLEEAKEGNDIDLASFEAYIALTSSSIVGRLPIEPKNFLIVEDMESVFHDAAVVTMIDENNRLKTYQDNDAEVSNSIFDGQSLIDKSLMGEYDVKGMVLLRNRYFKSCCFNTNIQQFFEDNGITSVDQLNGFTLATDIKDVKVITTPSSIKFYKFNNNYADWFKYIDPYFGVVKYEKDTHYFDGNLVQTHYQLINTLQFTRDEMEEFLKPSFDYLDAISTDKHVMRHHVKWSDSEYTENSLATKNDIVYTMLGYKNDFDHTKIYKDFRKETKKAFLNNIKRGHVYINGTYATLLGNPYEMLLHSIGKFDINNPYMQVGTVHNIRYADGEELLGCRSPHVTISNLLLTKNVHYEMINKYFNLTRNIVCINAINENILERLSGADFDSDAMIISNDKLIIKTARINYDIFKVPTSMVKGKKTPRKYTKEQMADLDIKTGKNLIGEIINFSQILNSLLWDRLYQLKRDDEVRASATEHFDEIKELFYDICQLDVMSCIEIDKAKKEFAIDNKKELDALREKYAEELQLDDKGVKPKFFEYLNKSKGYYIKGAKEYVEHHTSMDYLADIVAKKERCKYWTKDEVPFSTMFEPIGDKSSINWRQVANVRKACTKYSAARQSIWTKDSLDNDEKRLLCQREKEDLNFDTSKVKLNPATMYELIKTIDDDKYKDIKSVIFDVLFLSNKDRMKEYMAQMEKDVDEHTYKFYNIEIQG